MSDGANEVAFFSIRRIEESVIYVLHDSIHVPINKCSNQSSTN